MNVIRLRSAALHRVVRVSARYASALPGYPTPGTAFSPPPAPSRVTEDAPTTSASARVPTGSNPAPPKASPLGQSTAKSTAPMTSLPKSDVPIFTSLDELRLWREKAFREGKTVGFVPTMGALHDGHITLVRESLKENDLTVVSIYVNPSQFAPHEDLATYPRTLESDMSLLSACSFTPPNSDSSRRPSAVFLPSTGDLYPFGHSHSEQIGTYVLPPPSLASQMEGKSRPTFFRGVATVVTKLLNGVLPTRVYFGQKDIQQALLMRGMARDLCMGARVRIIKTVREGNQVVTAGTANGNDQVEGLALSSRNAYLTPSERVVAPTLRRALGAVEAAWYAGAPRADAIAAGKAVVDEAARRAEGVAEMRLDYIEMNDPKTFEVVPESLRVGSAGDKGPAVILSGALWVGRTRLIDNILLGNAEWVFE